MDHHLWIGFIGGLVAFAHCLGMCGGFVLHLSRAESGSAMIAGIISWHAGRLFTYAFLGAVAGYAGAMAGNLLRHAWLQEFFSYATGAVIVLMGLAVLGLLPARERISGTGSVAALLGRSLFTTPSPGSGLVLGITTGCLPCPVILGFLAYAVHSGSVAHGMAIMAGMGAGTIGPLLLLGAFGRLIGLHIRRWGRVAGGIILIVLGMSTILRGTPWYHGILGCRPQGETQSSRSTAASPTCCPGGDHAKPAGR